MRAALRRLGAAYDEGLRRRPVLVKCLTSAAIAGAGDLVAQTLFEDDDLETAAAGLAGAGPTQQSLAATTTATTTGAQIDVARFLRFFVLGGTLVGPTLHVWYGYLGARFASRSLTSTIKRVVLDQAVFTPLFLPVFLTAVGALEGKSAERSIQDVSAIWASTVVMNWAWWTPVQVANFGYVPARYQVLFSNAAGVVWNSYLSFVNQRSRQRAS